MEEKLQKIFQGAFIDINKNHNEAFLHFEKYCNRFSRECKILVNYDTHSDVYINTPLEIPNIANWVNFCFSKCGINQFYWIIPDYIIGNKKYKDIYKHKSELFLRSQFASFEEDDLDFSIVNSKKYLINKKNNELISSGKISHIENKCKNFNIKSPFTNNQDLSEVSMNIMKSDNLKELSSKEIILSIDADAFCNTGFDTNEHINNLNISKDELNLEFEKFINVLYYNDIKVKCASLTVSPGYSQLKFRDEIISFFNKIKSFGI